MDHKLLAFILVSVPMVCYAVAAGTYFLGLGRYGMGLCFFGYTIANVELIMDLYGK